MHHAIDYEIFVVQVEVEVQIEFFVVHPLLCLLNKSGSGMLLGVIPCQVTWVFYDNMIWHNN